MNVCFSLNRPFRRPSQSMKAGGGFTLVEMSIVLVVIALVVGGLVAGNALIESSHVRSQVSQVESFKAAAQAFRTKYNCLPGDCTNATTFFGTRASCWAVSTAPARDTCNGDGNGIIFQYDSMGRARWEAWTFWQHMANADLIQPQLSGGAADTTYYRQAPGVNVPRAAYPGGMVAYGVDYYSPPLQPETFRVGAVDNTGSTGTELFTPSTAFQIDSKIDDGIPSTGVVRSYELQKFSNGPAYENNNGTGCMKAYTGSQYNTSFGGVRCTLFFTYKLQ